VLPNIERPQAFKCKFDANGESMAKYIKFTENYADIPFSFCSYLPFDNDFLEK
jgi:hypothetical protein